ncbi:MAG: sulfate adenylyltransferase subunit CysD [Candidatus Cloacimonetes bacterium]|nr:sulfate adenylyltransferase subunit CysD [Candidatus Cloacimonadota bacterium]MCF8315118.1 sulfate adenylyltransferase subunit CysD [Ignavibacteriales bacterium]MCF8435886.1 sulfate adenylyltransferase subunit CysD [Ignavibacteriales bacterium]
MERYYITHLKELESESIYVLREVAAQFENPVLLFSGGKDSIVLGWLSKKAFHPAKIPYPLMHVDTGHNFDETMVYRDNFINLLGARLIVASVEASIRKGRVSDETGKYASRNVAQTTTLLDAIEEHKFDCAIGGARRDEEKARAKERFFSHRDEFGQWDPKNQRPELWNVFNGKKNPGEHFRVFPLSNWTEMDVWQYIAMENIPIPSIYFAHKRKVVHRDGIMLAVSPFVQIDKSDNVEELMVRCRTVGDLTSTGVWRSDAATIEDIINEVAASRITERGGRFDDKRSDTSMEERKIKGYF